jgi:two-component system response regulator FlrC
MHRVEPVSPPHTVAGDGVEPEDSNHGISTPEQPAHLQEEDHDGAVSLGDDLRQQEFRIIIQTLRKERGRRNRAAEQLGISPRTLRYKLAQMRDAGIDLDAEMAVV